MKNRLIAVFQHSYAPLFPWGGIALCLVLVLGVMHNVGVAGAQAERDRLEQEWITMRQSLANQREARKAKHDLNQVWAVFPTERDFAPLALGISDEAKRNGVTLPAMSYKMEPTRVTNMNKGVLQGSMSGRYEDLRRFIHSLETAEELLFIEDLELARFGSEKDTSLTFNIKIATYLRADAEKPPAQESR
jgi:Tfp pilus assembly protein PilO